MNSCVHHSGNIVGTQLTQQLTSHVTDDHGGKDTRTPTHIQELCIRAHGVRTCGLWLALGTACLTTVIAMTMVTTASVNRAVSSSRLLRAGCTRT